MRGSSLSRCKPLLIATYNPEEGNLREHLLDRIAITLSADVPPTFEDRVAAVMAASRFQVCPLLILPHCAAQAHALHCAMPSISNELQHKSTWT